MTNQNALTMNSLQQYEEAQRQKRVMDVIREEVHRIANYTPKIGIFGDTGNGKSSLANGLFGQSIAQVGDIEACTREPQEIFLGGAKGEGGITLVDVPGIGEDQERHDEYIALYKSLLPELDLVVWTLRSDVRNDFSALQAYKEVIESNENAPPVVFVLTQVDKIKPHREWNENDRIPGPNQAETIKDKIISVSNKFGIPEEIVIPVSAEEGYNLVALVELMVKVLPNDQKFSVTREAKEEVVSEEAIKQAGQGFWARIKEVAGEGWERFKDECSELIVQATFAVASRFANRALQFFLNRRRS